METAFDKVQIHHDTNYQHTRNIRELHQPNKGHFQKPTYNIIYNKQLGNFHLKMENGAMMSIFNISTNIH